MKLKCFNTVLQTFMNNYQTILNYFDNRSTIIRPVQYILKTKKLTFWVSLLCSPRGSNPGPQH